MMELEKQIDEVFELVLKNWMYGVCEKYGAEDFGQLRENLAILIRKKLPLKFLLPAFPCKSPNVNQKVLGVSPDFVEVKAIECLLKTLRELEIIYEYGAKIVLMSDYHTFDQYVGVDEENYNIYFAGLKKIIHQIGGEDVIELICLSNFPHFSDTKTSLVSTKLNDDFGDAEYAANFDKRIANDPMLMRRYRGMREFMKNDLAMVLSGKGRKEKERHLKRVAKGMMVQGVALDKFLRTQTYVTDYIRLSIHPHHPRTGKFCLDFFKDFKSHGRLLRDSQNFWGLIRHSVSKGQSKKGLCRTRSEQVDYEHVVKTPWHSSIVFDSRRGEYKVDRRAEIARSHQEDHPDDSLVKATYNGQDYLYLWINIAGNYLNQNPKPELEAEIIRPGCGIVIKSRSKDIPFDAIHQGSIAFLIKEFGIVILRGFSGFKGEEDIIKYYSRESDLIKWKFGPIHKVRYDTSQPGIVNSRSALNHHFDFILPPKYFNITQDKYEYKDYVCREFLLYCKWISDDFKGGQTTFIDAVGAVKSLPGQTIKVWEKTLLEYETVLREKKDDGMELYFGGEGNKYHYPLVMNCPWTGHKALRWMQDWNESNNSTNPQPFFSEIKESPEHGPKDVRLLQREIEKLVFDDRFYFEHSYESNDAVFINNYTTLHARNAFTGGRELWRIQAVPPSDNTPDYYVNQS